ncbi:MAG: efflux RND transporter periplasmic adaptor subunit [Bacteroidota bacterium]
MRLLKTYVSLFLLLLIGCDNEHAGHEGHPGHKQQPIYTCPMHPQIIRDRPGQCPICGMDLVEKPREGEADTSLSILLKPANEYVLSQVKAIRPVEMKIPAVLAVSGVIGYDTRKVNTVSARVNGRIENLYVKSRFQRVVAGQKLFDIYSPELVTEQENLIYLLNNDPENTIIINAAEKKLALLGLTTDQVEEVKRTKKAFYSISVYSPYSGQVHEPETDVNPVVQGTMSQGASAPGELSVKEGMYVQKGQIIFAVYDTRSVWALLNIDPESQNLVRVNQRAVIRIGMDTIETSVGFIEPAIRQHQKSVTVRCYLKNPGNNLKIGTVITANIYGDSIPGLYVPFSAVLSLGQKKAVFVMEEGLFRARQVSAGFRADDWISIISGIDGTDSIAANAQLLIDSESFVKLKEQE